VRRVPAPCGFWPVLRSGASRLGRRCAAVSEEEVLAVDRGDFTRMLPEESPPRAGCYDLAAVKKRPYRIEYSPSSRDHLAALDARHRATILDKVDVQLTCEPTAASRNRKPLQLNPLARFELRIGDLRVYYEVEERARVVEIRAVGIKDRNRVLIGGEEVDLS
jgi:mRNA-degrading endonuclease RelE of RelBE toxin-antitoxin system